jgi:hypothetical protein
MLLIDIELSAFGAGFAGEFEGLFCKWLILLWLPKDIERRTGNGNDEIQGSPHCATDGEAVRCFGRDDVFSRG